MAESEKKSKSNSLVIVLIVILILLLGTVGFLLIREKDNFIDSDSGDDKFSVNTPIIKYDEAAVLLDDENLQEEIDRMKAEVEKGNVALQYKNLAVSKDGKNFACTIGNSLANGTDMYFNIYKDDTFTEQILLTGLIPPGSGIDSFESEIKLDPGTYNAVLAFTQVEDDHQTIKAQVLVALTLEVG